MNDRQEKARKIAAGLKLKFCYCTDHCRQDRELIAQAIETAVAEAVKEHLKSIHDAEAFIRCDPTPEEKSDYEKSRWKILDRLAEYRPPLTPEESPKDLCKKCMALGITCNCA
jgi:hypothetical protein